jgi:hypothetical protein
VDLPLVLLVSSVHEERDGAGAIVETAEATIARGRGKKHRETVQRIQNPFPVPPFGVVPG